MRSEFDRELKDLTNTKTSGEDRIFVGVLRRNAEDEILERLFNLLNKIYESGGLPTDFKKVML